MKFKERALDVLAVIIGIIYLVGLTLVPDLIGNRYNY